MKSLIGQGQDACLPTCGVEVESCDFSGQPLKYSHSGLQGASTSTLRAALCAAVLHRGYLCEQLLHLQQNAGLAWTAISRKHGLSSQLASYTRGHTQACTALPAFICGHPSNGTFSRESYLGHDMGSVLHDFQQGTNRGHILPPVQAVPQVVQSPRHTVSDCQQLVL